MDNTGPPFFGENKREMNVEMDEKGVDLESRNKNI